MNSGRLDGDGKLSEILNARRKMVQEKKRIEMNDYCFSGGKILVACEESQTITIALRRAGFEAYSCDILPPSGGHPEWHLQGDAIKEAYSGKYTAMIAHPPCTYLTVTGNKWFFHPDDKHLPTNERRPHPKFPNRRQDREDGVKFFADLLNAPIRQIAIENPVGIISTRIRKPNQIIQPYEYGDPHAKKTCLWLKNFSKLQSTKIVEPEYVTFKSGKRMAKWYVDAAKLSGKERACLRSKTFPGIADAIVTQWFCKKQRM